MGKSVQNYQKLKKINLFLFLALRATIISQINQIKRIFYINFLGFVL